jgi:hypothetical protein
MVNRILESKTMSENLVNNICALDANLIKQEVYFESQLQDKVTRIFDKLEKLYKEILDPMNMNLFNSYRESLHILSEQQLKYEELKTKVNGLLE